MQYQKKINGIVRHMDDFKTSIPFFTSQVWKDLSKEFNNPWDARSWYTNVKYNRQNILIKAREKMGISVESPQTYSITCNTSCSSLVLIILFC